MSYDRIACAKKARKTDVSVAGVWIVQNIARCGACFQGFVDVVEMNIIYDEREAP